jgi:hypothetical protein
LNFPLVMKSWKTFTRLCNIAWSLGTISSRTNNKDSQKFTYKKITYQKIGVILVQKNYNTHKWYHFKAKIKDLHWPLTYPLIPENKKRWIFCPWFIKNYFFYQKSTLLQLNCTRGFRRRGKSWLISLCGK